MESVKAAATFATSHLIRPAYYKEQFAGFSKYYYWKYIRPGSMKPLAHLMVLTGVLGYTVEWFALGQHHVAHKKAIVDKALAEHSNGH
ncbi:hypothetical protein VYU27_006226 [Nannochloropsis oceanica]